MNLNRLTVLKIRSLGVGMHCDGGGLYVQVRGPGSRSWVFRYTLNGKSRDMGLGSLHNISLSEAREAAGACRKLLASGIDPIKYRKQKPVRALEQRVTQKALEFLEAGMEPECYLYRHFHPSGELLYVGISLRPLKRQEAHARGAEWRNMISRILIEPFATREEALAGEEEAIREEFPRFNVTFNGRRHPVEELSSNNPVHNSRSDLHRTTSDDDRQATH